MTSRRALTLVIALVVLATPGLAAAGGFAFAIAGGRLVAVGSGSGAIAVGALGMAIGADMSTRSLGTPIPSLLVVEAVPLDAEVTLDGKPVGTARERASYALDLAPRAAHGHHYGAGSQAADSGVRRRPGRLHDEDSSRAGPPIADKFTASSQGPR